MRLAATPLGCPLLWLPTLPFRPNSTALQPPLTTERPPLHPPPAFAIPGMDISYHGGTAYPGDKGEDGYANAKELATEVFTTNQPAPV